MTVKNKIFSDDNVISALTADDTCTSMALKTTRWLRCRAYDYAIENGWSPNKFDIVANLSIEDWVVYRKIWRQAMVNTPWIRNIQRSNCTSSLRLSNADYLMLIDILAGREAPICLHLKKLSDFLVSVKNKSGGQVVINNFFINSIENSKNSSTVLMPIIRNHGVLNGSIVSLGLSSHEPGWVTRFKNNYLEEKFDFELKFQYIVYESSL